MKIKKLETDMGKFPNNIDVKETRDVFQILEARNKINEIINILNKRELKPRKKK